jgi:hypothetical protein
MTLVTHTYPLAQPGFATFRTTTGGTITSTITNGALSQDVAPGQTYVRVVLQTLSFDEVLVIIPATGPVDLSTLVPQVPAPVTTGLLTTTSIGTVVAGFNTSGQVLDKAGNPVTGGAGTPATTTAQGTVKLSGDLAGTADLPTVPGVATNATAITTERTRAQGAEAALYTKPGTGIPAADLASAVQGNLTAATTAVQPAGLTKTAVGLGNVDNTSDTAKPLSTAASTALGAKADLVSGLVPTSQIPALALTTAAPVASQAAMLALTAAQVQPGDLAVRSDGAGTFILTTADPSTLANWLRLNSPTDVVTSVNGQLGTVILAAADVGAPPTTRAITAGTGLTGGGSLALDRALAVTYGTAAGTAAQGNDGRLSDSRAPSGPAGGELAGSFPNPTVPGLGGKEALVTRTGATAGQVPVLQADSTLAFATPATGGGSAPASFVFGARKGGRMSIPQAPVAQTASAVAVNRAVASPFYLTETHVLASISVMLWSGAAGAVIRVGLYADDAAGGYPGAVVVQSGALDASTGSQVLLTSTVTGVTLTPGTYWMVYVCQGTAAGSEPLALQRGSALAAAYLPSTSSGTAAGWAVNGVTGALPSLFTGSPATATPIKDTMNNGLLPVTYIERSA